MKNETTSPTPRDYVQGKPEAIARRNLTEDTCRKWGYWCGAMNGEPVQIANYKTTRRQDVRTKDTYT